LSPHDAGDLVPQLSSDDLFHLIRRIGLADAEGVLALADSHQVRAMLDSDAWERDIFSIERLDPWLNTLMRAGPEVLGKHLMGLDDSVISMVMQSSIQVLVIDEPEDFAPPDVEHVLSPDGTLCICFPESAPRDLPVKIFLDWLAQMKPVYLANLLVHLPAALKTNLEEDAYRWRTGRMADRGYVDYYDALRIYVPATAQQIRDAHSFMPDDQPVVAHWLTPLSQGASRLEAALSAVSPDALDQVQSSLALAINMALSADRVELWDEEHQEEIVQRFQAGLLLGLDTLNGPDASPESDARTLENSPCVLVFRIGYGRMLKAAEPARRTATVNRLRGTSGRVDAVDVAELRDWAEWLTARHPSLPGGAAPSSVADLDRMTDKATLLADFARVAGTGRPQDVGLVQYVLTRFICAYLGLDTDGPLPIDALVNAHAALIDGGRVPDSTVDALQMWWIEAGGYDRRAPETLMQVVIDEMGAIPSHELDPKLLPLLWVGEPGSH